MEYIRIKRNNFSKSIFGAIQICLYILGVILILIIAWKIGTSIGNGNWPPSIETIANWSEVLIAYAALFAIGQYAISYLDIADKKTKNVLEYVKFFRESVIASGNRIRNNIKKSKRKPIPMFLIRKNTPYLKFTKDEFFKKIEPNQGILIKQYSDMIADDLELEEMILDCLNATEEFAIGIVNSNSHDHIGTTSIRRPFVHIVEEFAVPLYFHIGVINDGFPYLSELYRYWKNNIGFIPYDVNDRIEDYQNKIKQYKKKL